MNRFEKWKRETNRKLRRKALEDRDSHLFHSHYFHQFFEGYKEYREVDEKGHVKIRRVYEGIVYQSKLSAGPYWLVRLLYVALFAGMVFSLIGAALTQSESGGALYVILPEIATIVCIFWLLYTLFVSYLFAPKKMTVDDYRTSHGSIRTVTRILTFCFMADSLVTLVYTLLCGSTSNILIAAGLFGLGAICAAIINLIEGKLPYDEIIPKKSPDDAEGNAFEVEYDLDMEG